MLVLLFLYAAAPANPHQLLLTQNDGHETTHIALLLLQLRYAARPPVPANAGQPSNRAAPPAENLLPPCLLLLLAAAGCFRACRAFTLALWLLPR